MPCRMSIITTSASCLSTRRWATVAPTFPAPITVTFFRIMLSPLDSLSATGERLASREGMKLEVYRPRSLSLVSNHRPSAELLQILNHRVRKRAGSQFFHVRGPFHLHQSLQVIRHTAL